MRHPQICNDPYLTEEYRKAADRIRQTSGSDASVQFTCQQVQVSDVKKDLQDLILTWKYGGNSLFREALKVYGVGPSLAQEWCKKYSSMTEVYARENLGQLRKEVYYGLAYREDYLQPMNGSEVERHVKLITDLWNSVQAPRAQNNQLAVELVFTGSIRRQRQHVFDIDVLFILSEPPVSDASTGVAEAELRHRGFTNLMSLMRNKGYLETHLAGGDAASGWLWRGIVRLTGQLARRLDFFLVPYAQRGAALCYYTGSELYNRTLEMVAAEHGLYLSSKGIYKLQSGSKNSKRVREDQAIEALDEAAIYKHLDLLVPEPSDRKV